MIVANSYCRSFRFLEKATSRRLWTPFILLISIFLPISNANSDQLIEMRESKYNNIYVYQKGEYISMTFGHNRRIFVESVYNPQNEKELPVIYTRYMTVAIVYAKALESILQIGLGGGRTSWYTHKHLPNTSVTAVEIDPEVISLAKKYFGIKEEKTFHIVARDGRLYLARNQDQYDIIFIDAYRGPFVPFHLLTKEFYHIVKTRLKPGGVVVAVAPGYVNTAILKAMNQEALAAILKDVHSGRLVEPGEIAACIMHCIENDAINATTIEVTGGLTYARSRAK